MNRAFLSIFILSILYYPITSSAQQEPSKNSAVNSFTGELIEPSADKGTVPTPPLPTTPTVDAPPSLDLSELEKNGKDFTLTLPTTPSEPGTPEAPRPPELPPLHNADEDPDLAPVAVTSTTLPSEGKPPAAPLSVIEVYKFQLQLAESTYHLSKDLASHSELLLAYERLIGPLCMSSAHTNLDYQGYDIKNTECADLIGKAEALFPKSPVVICAKEGFDSEECKTLTTKQPRGTMNFRASDSNSGKPLFDVEAKLQQSSLEPKLKAVNEGLEKIDNDTKLTDDEKKKRFRRVFSLGIDMACRLFRVRLDQIGGTSEDPILRRTRLVTEECDSFLNRAENYVPNIPAIACARYGYYSPNCIDAIRTFRAEEQLTPIDDGVTLATPTPKDDIGRF